MTDELVLESFTMAGPLFPSPDIVRLRPAIGMPLVELYVYEWGTQAVSVYLEADHLRQLAAKANELAEDLEDAQEARRAYDRHILAGGATRPLKALQEELDL